MHSLTTAQALIDALAVRTHGRTRLGLLGYREGLSAQGNDVLAVDRGVEDLVLLHVVEELRGVVVGRRILADIRALNSLSRRTHAHYHAASVSKLASPPATLIGMTPSNSRDNTRHTPRSGRRRGRRFGRETYLITTAKLAPGQDRHRREIIYSILQFLRVPSLLIAGSMVYVWQWWIPAALVVAVTFPLPWIAVVIGNGRGQKKDKCEKAVYKPAIARQMAQAQREELTSGTHGELPGAPGRHNPSSGADANSTATDTIDHED